MLGLVVACHPSMQVVVWTTTKRKLRKNIGGVNINTNSTNYLVHILSSQGLFLLVDNAGQLKTPIGHHHFVVTTTILKLSWGKTSPNFDLKNMTSIYTKDFFNGKKWLKFIKF